MIHVVLVSAYPTEAAARAAISDDQFRGAKYLGIWLMPEPYRSAVHVFSDAGAGALEADGWKREDA